MIEHIRDIIPRVLDELERRMDLPDQLGGINTGFGGLNELLDGWKPELYVLAGRPSMGKSALIKDFVLAAAFDGKKPHLVNIEDGNYMTAKRMLSSHAGLEMWKIRKARLRKDEMGVLIKRAGDLAEYEITFDDLSFSVSEIEKSVMEAYKRGADIIFVDYLQMIRGEGDGKRRVDEIGDICRRLKAMSKPNAYNIPVVVTAQLNRDVEKREDKRPCLADLRDSGEIEQHADVVMMLYREGYYKRDKSDTATELIIVKGRNVGTGKIKLRFDGERMKFYDAD